MYATYQAINAAFGENGAAAMHEYADRLRHPAADAGEEDEALAAANRRRLVTQLIASGARAA